MNRLPRNEGVFSTETLRATDRIIRPDEELIACSVVPGLRTWPEYVKGIHTIYVY